MPRERRFLTAEWRHLLILNFEMDPGLLRPLVPRGTELDAWDGLTLVSLVGFRFLDTRMLGLAIPFHRDFDEVNLRLYVRRRAADGGWRRGVVFIRELVPKRWVAWVARLAWREPYRRVPMTHAIELGGFSPDRPGEVSYAWHRRGQRWRISGEVRSPLLPLPRPSEAEFITEHFWGYSRRRAGGTLEYEVRHPPWLVTEAHAARFHGDAAPLFGEEFREPLAGPPHSAFYADGSAVVVLSGCRMA